MQILCYAACSTVMLIGVPALRRLARQPLKEVPCQEQTMLLSVSYRHRKRHINSYLGAPCVKIVALLCFIVCPEMRKVGCPPADGSNSR